MFSRKIVCGLTLTVSGVLLLAVYTVAGGPADSLAPDVPAADALANAEGFAEITGSDPEPATALEPFYSNAASSDPSYASSPNQARTAAEALQRALDDYRDAADAQMSDEALRAIERTIIDALSKSVKDDAKSFDKAIETYKKVMEALPSNVARDEVERALLRARGYAVGSDSSRSGYSDDNYYRAKARALSALSSTRPMGSPSPEYLLRRRKLVGEERQEMAQRLQEDAQLDKEAHAIAKQYLTADDRQKKSQLEAQLRELTERHFDLRQQRRELQVTQLEEELKRVRESIQQRNEAREQIIERRISKLLHREHSLDF